MTFVRGNVRRRRRLGYRFVVEPAGVSLTRFLIGEGDAITPLTTPLSSPMSRALVMEIAPREQDLHLDRLIGSAVQKYRVQATLGAVMTALDGAPNVALDERAVSVDKEPVMPRVVIAEVAEGFELRFERNPSVDGVPGPGLALVGDVLRPLGEVERTGLKLERLPVVVRYRREQAGELVSKVLPDLERRLVVEYQTDRLPGRTRTLKPRVEFELISEGEVLVVRASLVYGVPPVAKVLSGRLVQLGGVTPRRMLDAEKHLELSLREELDVLLDRPLRLEGLDAGRFMERLHAWRRRHEDTSSREMVSNAVELEPVVELKDGEPHLSFVGHLPNGETCSVPAAVVLRAHVEGIEQVPLSSGGWGTLPKLWLAAHGAILEDYLSAREASQGGRSAGALLLETNLAELGLTAPAGVEDYAARLASRGDLELPPDLSATLRPYQRDGVAWLQALRDSGLGGILADDMGLGKTLQTLSVLTGRSLVVVPKSVLFNWRQELAKFRPSLSVCVYHGAQRSLEPDAAVVLTTYAILRMDQAVLEQIEWDCLVLDEAQTIKNSDSQATQSAHALRARFRLALTGTPIENRLEELWSEMQFANPGLLGGLTSFKRRFIEPMERGESAAYERLRRRIRPFVLRRMKTEVAPELPPKTEDVLWVELEPGERQVYDAILGDSRSKLGASKDRAESKSVMDALEVLLRLRQVCCHSALLPGRTDPSSSKIDRLFESLDEVIEEGQKAIVFSQWTSLLDLVQPGLEQREIPFVRLDGSTRDRQAVVTQFQEDPACRILLASLKAGGTGLNLTAADHVYLLDPWWNPAVEAQAADRAHRIGRERPVFVHRLIARDTVEERVLKLQDRKRALGQFVEGADPTSGLTQAEIEELLQ
jgi:superfamily II DNA or RNA helicase